MVKFGFLRRFSLNPKPFMRWFDVREPDSACSVPERIEKS